MNLGFAILSHDRPRQLERLVHSLNALYDGPPITCHHDFGQSGLDESRFPSNARFVRPNVATAWGKWSLVDATLQAIRLLYEVADPDYFFLISATDYPTAPAEKVRADLSGADAFIDHYDLLKGLKDAPPPGDPHLAHHRAPHNIHLARNHYLRTQLYIPIVRRRPPLHSTTRYRHPRLGRLTVDVPIHARRSPFDAAYRCYHGSQWFTASRKAARKLLNPSAKDRQLQRYYRSRVLPDESYMQTVLANDRSLRLVDRTHRYARWEGAHPIELAEADFGTIIASGAHFARKFGQDAPVLDMLDEHLGLRKRV